MKEDDAPAESGPLPALTRPALWFLLAVLLAAPCLGNPSPLPSAAPEGTAPRRLREAFADDFPIGVALGAEAVTGRDSRAAALAAAEFSSLTAENAMKWSSLQPQEGKFHFAEADAFTAFAARHRMDCIGHTLVWHHQTPDWVFEGETGKVAGREQLVARMRDHIHAVVGRYKGKVKGWDVVNEALSDGGDDPWRDSPWRRIIGDDFIELAFRFAREADPAAELYYNDYGLENPRKRANAIAMIRKLQARGVPITGIGTQSHFQLDGPPLVEVEKTIVELAALDLKVMVTELDVDVLPSARPAGNADLSRRAAGGAGLDPYREGLPEAARARLAERYRELFRIYLHHRASIARVTFWGLHDGQSWLNSFPVRGRVNHPLLFNRDLQPKQAYFEVLALGQSTTSEDLRLQPPRHPQPEATTSPTR